MPPAFPLAPYSNQRLQRAGTECRRRETCLQLDLGPTHQGVLVDEPCMSQAVRSEILHGVHGSTTTRKGQPETDHQQLSAGFLRSDRRNR